MSAPSRPAASANDVVWHDVECGSYTADLATWLQIAREAAGPVLELGVGTGRVALRLAAAEVDVSAMDSSSTLVDELRRRARIARLAIDATTTDARDFSLDRRFRAIIAPMQLVHQLGGAQGRGRMLEVAAAHLAPGGALAAAVLAEWPVRAPASGSSALLPDVIERAGWVFSSLPLEVRAVPDAVEVVRLRQLVAPSGELDEAVASERLDALDPDRFEAEAGAVGLRARERLAVEPTADHVGSVVCVLEGP